jgi:hypothetical protein
MSESGLAGSLFQADAKVSSDCASKNSVVEGFHLNSTPCFKPKNPFQTPSLPAELPQSSRFSNNPFLSIRPITGPMSMAHLKGFGGIMTSNFPAAAPVVQPIFGKMNTFGVNEMKNEPTPTDLAKPQVRVDISKQTILSVKAPRHRPSRAKGEIKERIRTLRKKLELPVLQISPDLFDESVDSDFLMDPTQEQQSSGHVENVETQHHTFHEYLLLCAEVRKLTYSAHKQLQSFLFFYSLIKRNGPQQTKKIRYNKLENCRRGKF